MKKVKSCIYLTCDGIDIQDNKRSLAFLSFVSAIEGLVSLEVAEDEITFECHNCKTIKDSPHQCPKCGRPIWGIKTKFVEFLRKFVAGSEKSAQIYREVYNLRCKITHQNQLFSGDYDLSLDQINEFGTPRLDNEIKNITTGKTKSFKLVNVSRKKV